jgi:hypothetical protein
MRQACKDWNERFRKMIPNHCGMLDEECRVWNGDLVLFDKIFKEIVNPACYDCGPSLEEIDTMLETNKYVDLFAFKSMMVSFDSNVSKYKYKKYVTAYIKDSQDNWWKPYTNRSFDGMKIVPSHYKKARKYHEVECNLAKKTLLFVPPKFFMQHEDLCDQKPQAFLVIPFLIVSLVDPQPLKKKVIYCANSIRQGFA